MSSENNDFRPRKTSSISNDENNRMDFYYIAKTLAEAYL